MVYQILIILAYGGRSSLFFFEFFERLHFFNVFNKLIPRYIADALGILHLQAGSAASALLSRFQFNVLFSYFRGNGNWFWNGIPDRLMYFFVGIELEGPETSQRIILVCYFVGFLFSLGTLAQDLSRLFHEFFWLRTKIEV